MLCTRYAPVRRFPGAEAPFSLDLHVLSLPLAFILSQDQTLRCNKLFGTEVPFGIPLRDNNWAYSISIQWTYFMASPINQRTVFVVPGYFQIGVTKISNFFRLLTNRGEIFLDIFSTLHSLKELVLKIAKQLFFKSGCKGNSFFSICKPLPLKKLSLPLKISVKARFYCFPGLVYQIV